MFSLKISLPSLSFKALPVVFTTFYIPSSLDFIFQKICSLISNLFPSFNASQLLFFSTSVLCCSLLSCIIFSLSFRLFWNSGLQDVLFIGASVHLACFHCQQGCYSAPYSLLSYDNYVGFSVDPCLLLIPFRDIGIPELWESMLRDSFSKYRTPSAIVFTSCCKNTWPLVLCD